MTLNEKIVYELSTKNVLPLSALRALSPNSTNLYRQLVRLVSDGYVREKDYIVKDGRRQKKVKYYSLTSAGIVFFAETMLDTIPWFNYVEEVSDVRIMGKSCKSSYIATRYAKVATAALMADTAGAKENTLFVVQSVEEEDPTEDTVSSDESPAYNDDFSVENESTSSVDPDDEFYIPPEIEDYYNNLAMDLRDGHCDFHNNNSLYDKEDRCRGKRSVLNDLMSDDQGVSLSAPTLASVVTNAIEKYYETGRYRESDIRFIDALVIKGKMLEAANNKGVTPPDLRGGRYSGMIGSTFRVALVYTASELEPIKWRRNFLKRELIAYSGGRQLFFSANTIDYKPNAILLVTNEKAFAASYEAVQSSHQKAKRGKNSEPIKYGEGFDKFWVVPISTIGSSELHTIMSSACEADHKQISAKLLGNGQYIANRSNLSGTFPLVDEEDGSMTTVVTHLDIMRICHIHDSMKRFPQNSYTILCRDWQIPYVKAIVAHSCKILPLDDSVVGLKPMGPVPMMAIEKEAALWSAEN